MATVRRSAHPYLAGGTEQDMAEDDFRAGAVAAGPQLFSGKCKTMPVFGIVFPASVCVPCGFAEGSGNRPSTHLPLEFKTYVMLCRPVGPI